MNIINNSLFEKKTFKNEEIKLAFRDFKLSKNKPLIIEISGSPNSGKTSAIHAIEKIVKQQGIKVKIIYEAATKCRLKDKLSIDFNIWTANLTINSILEALNNSYDMIICERGFFDCLCWLEFHTKNSNIPFNSIEEIYNFYKSKKWFENIDFIYVMTCSPEASIKREYLDGLTEVSGTIVNKKVLSIIDESISATIEKNKEDLKNIYMLDTTYLDQISINRTIVSSILSELQKTIAS